MKENVKIKFFGTLRDYTENKSEIIFSFKKKITIKQILSVLEIPLSLVSFATLNGTIANLNKAVEDNDELMIFPIIIGG